MVMIMNEIREREGEHTPYPFASQHSRDRKSEEIDNNTMWLLQLPSIPKLKLNLSTPFLHGSGTTPLTTTPSPSPSPSPPSFLPPVRAMKSMQGKVVCATNDKTVAVEVVRLAPHPKYKRRVRKKKKYQAHDPDNQFKIGDIVQLLKSRPISKTKTFLAVAVPKKEPKNKPLDEAEAEPEAEPSASRDIGIPLESQQQQQQA